LPRASADGVAQLTWVPWDRSLQPPAGLTDFQQAWFWNLLRASFFDQTEMQGYLPITSNLWSIAGAKRSDFFDSHKSRLLACFEVRKVGGKEVIYFPPLIQSMRRQLKRLRNRRVVDDELSTNSQASTEGAGAFTSPSQSDLGFDFDSDSKAQLPKHKPKPSSTRVRAEQSGYSQADFDARDLRLLKKAYDEFHDRYDRKGSQIGTPDSAPAWTDDPRKVFEWVCRLAGLTVERGLQLEESQKKWPEKVPEWARSASAGD